jgi:hypothetical protein
VRNRRVRILGSLLLLTVVLSGVPATAAPGRGDGPDRSGNRIERVLSRVASFVVHLCDDTLSIPRP